MVLGLFPVDPLSVGPPMVEPLSQPLRLAWLELYSASSFWAKINTISLQRGHIKWVVKAFLYSTRFLGLHFGAKPSESSPSRQTFINSQECTHVLIEELMPVREDLLDAIVAKKACVCSSWIESVAEEKIRTEIPSCSSHTSTLMVEEVSVKLADPRTRENCLEGYTFVLDSINSYKFGNQLQSLLEISGAKVLFAEGFTSTSHRSIFISPCVVVSSSCSTDETIVADSEAEDETATSVRETAAAHSREVVETVNKMKAKEDCDAPNYVATFRPSRGSVPLKNEADTESESGNLDVVCSQHLIVRDTSTRTASSTANNEGVNFKRFRKRDFQSGNSFNNLIPFSKYPYKGSDDGNEEMIESAKEEKRRKQMEAMADDLFNNVKGRRRGVAGSIHGLLTNGN